jgi:hypothetical protein
MKKALVQQEILAFSPSAAPLAEATHNYPDHRRFAASS